MSSISNSVGKNGVNIRNDVVTVQTLLNDNIRKLVPHKPLKVDGVVGKFTIDAIEEFQKKMVPGSQIDGRVDPHGPTFKALLACGCDQPKENFPYDEETFAVVKRLSGLVNYYSRKFGVPPVAVAGSIADEYNTQRGVKRTIDWFQDHVLIGQMPNFMIQMDEKLGFNSKMLNANQHDLGIGNIKLKTAEQIYNMYKSSFERKNMNYSDLVKYLNTDQGAVHIAALVALQANRDLRPYVQGFSEEKIEALYVTYYKQGPGYISRYVKTLSNDPGHRIEIGEGSRVLLQRDKIKSALGLK